MSEDREDGRAELRALREGIRALADERWLDPVNYREPVATVLRTIQVHLAALLAPSPAATTGEAECAGVRVNGPMSAMICDDDGWVRSGMWHHGTDYKCTGSVRPPLDSPIWPGHEIRCANPIHNVTQPAGTWVPATFVSQPDPTACPTCGANRGEHGVVNGKLCPRLTSPAPVSSGEAGAVVRVRAFVVARDAFYGREAGDEDLLDVAPADGGDAPTLLWSDLRALVNAPSPETYDDCYAEGEPS